MCSITRGTKNTGTDISLDLHRGMVERGEREIEREHLRLLEKIFANVT